MIFVCTLLYYLLNVMCIAYIAITIHYYLRNYTLLQNFFISDTISTFLNGLDINPVIPTARVLPCKYVQHTQ